MKKTFIICKLSPYFNNVRKEITKSPIYYFYDLGLRNFSCGEFGNLQDKGYVFQNFIFSRLKQAGAQENLHIYFWRTKDRTEVDFLLDFGKNIIPIEVKCTKMRDVQIPRSLRSFLERYSVKKTVIVNLSLEDVIEVNDAKVYIIPFWQILDDSFMDRLN